MFKRKQKQSNQVNISQAIDSIQPQQTIPKQVMVPKSTNLKNHGMQIGMHGFKSSNPPKKKDLKFHQFIELDQNIDQNMEKFIQQKIQERERGETKKEDIVKEENKNKKEGKFIDIDRADQTVQQKTIMIQGLREVVCPFEYLQSTIQREKVRNLEVIENLKRKRLFETVNVEKVLNEEKSKKQQKAEKQSQRQFGKYFKNDGRMKKTMIMRRQMENWKYEQNLQKDIILKKQHME